MKFDDPTVSFGVIADLQYCNAAPFKNRFYRNAIDKLNKAIAVFNDQKLDFVINLGDMIDRDWESFDTILPLFNQMKAPVYHVLGNHDYEVKDEKKAEVSSKIGIERYYDFSLNGWRFIVLDGNEISTFANLPATSEYENAEKLLKSMELAQKINANFWNGGVGEKQMAWLRSTLSKAEKENERSIIFCHYPLYPPNKHNLLNTEEMLSLIKNYKGVKMWLNGHNHDGNYGLFWGVHFLNVKGMVEGQADLVFSVVQLYENRIKVVGFGNEISATLTF